MNKILLYFIFISLAPITFALTPKERREVSDHLQDISVTIRSQSGYSKSEGSGVIITRNIGKEKVTFVWTCGHVVDNLRAVKTVIVDGSTKKVVEFDDVQIIKELVESGRRVGEIKMDATVIKFSDADDGEDLALLMVRAKDYGKANAEFYLDAKEPIIPIGTPLFHVGSLLGQMGSNSMTSGIISQVGRIHGKVEFDQTTVTAFPGSSGGGVYLQDGRYVGMIVRGAGEGFNLMVPVRRMKRWAEKHDIMWAIDPKVKIPSLEEIAKLPVESTSKEDEEESKKKGKKEWNGLKKLPFLIRTEKPMTVEEFFKGSR
jgi:S1-C subfamily serine protease